MLAVIVAALIFLACSYVKLFDDSDTSSSSFEKSEKPQHALHPEMEPRVVVIMAGQTNPTHIAKPIAAIPIPSTEEAWLINRSISVQIIFRLIILYIEPLING